DYYCQSVDSSVNHPVF
nr:immunoglobulin light chain junction region [Macaca mulatta]MOW04054.1 immunoglobulin light chain junction region [Macaca mulatta]MOW04072.1 immunoglobulin light chain junction region [Macaca mulatta]MOW04083.1 immunoglobulin light chain junction region [Macaca mulatta]MOW04157.1 immunoglobulin light chain junction region [Macaca mulatta]